MDHVAYIKGNIATREDRLKQIEQERDRLDRESVKITAELGAYQDMLVKFDGTTALISVPQSYPPPRERSASPTAFAMSNEWRIVFLALEQRAGKSFDAADVAHTGAVNGITLTTPSIRSQFAHYSKRGLLRKVGRGKYIITQKGRDKFASEAADLGASPKENGPPKGSPETGVPAPNFNLFSDRNGGA